MVPYYKQDYPDDILKAKEIIVLWSGGCDSTLLLYTYGYMIKNNDAKSVKLYTLSYDLDFVNPKKRERELEARKKIKEILAKDGITFDNITINITHDFTGNDFYNERGNREFGGLPLQLINSTYALALAHPDAKVLVGFLRQDCAMIAIDQFEKMVKAWNKISGKRLDFVLPLKHFTKESVIEDLLRINPKLYESTWYCEFPTYNNKPCGNCVPCQEQITALMGLWYKSQGTKNESIYADILKNTWGITLDKSPK